MDKRSTAGETPPLPEGWEWRKLGEVCEVISGQSPQSKFYNKNGDGLPFYQGKKGFTEKFIDSPNTWTTNITKEAQKDDILMSVRAPVGPVNFATQNICIGRGLSAIRAGNTVDKFFLFYFLVKHKNEITGNNGAVFNSINRDQIKAIQIPLPPLAEQKRIVTILDEAFAAIDKAKANAEKNLANAKELFESYLNRIFANPGEDWEEKKLGDIGKVLMCKRIFKNQTSESGDIPFYKIGTFGKEPNTYISKEIYNEYRNKYSFPKKGDILLSASGTIGRRVKYDGKPAYYQDSNIVWIDNDEKQVLNDYLYHFYSVCKWKATNGATISRLYNDNLRQIDISFPNSKEKQQLIIYKIDSLETESRHLESIYQQRLTALDELKKSILKKAFEGEL